MFGYFEGENFKVADLPEQKGKVVLVTGGNTGLGYATCEALAGKGAHVFMAARSGDKANKAIEKIKNKFSSAQVEWLELNLQDFTSIQNAAKDFQKRAKRCDALVCNAGIMANPYEMTKMGLESQFATNVMGHYVLTILLLPILISTSRKAEYKDGPTVRIVNLSSLGHKMAPGNVSFNSVEDVNRQFTRFGSSSAFARYGQSKLGNILFNNCLQKRLSNEKITCLAVHPGAVATELIRGPGATWGMAPVFNSISGFFFTAPDDGALTQVFATASPKIDEGDYKGAYLVPIAKKATPSAQAQDDKLSEDLWSFCAQYASDKAGIDVKSALKEARKPAEAAEQT